MYRNIFYLQENVLKIKRRNEFLLFAPNLTMNLTYLCSGDVNLERIFLSKKIYSIKFLKKI